MGHLNSNLPRTGASDQTVSHPVGEATSRGWLWVLIVIVVAALGYWYFRGPKASTEAQGPAAPGGSANGSGQGAFAGFAVPVVVSTSQRGDLPVYFNGLGTVTAFNNVTVHSRV